MNALHTQMRTLRNRAAPRIDAAFAARRNAAGAPREPHQTEARLLLDLCQMSAGSAAARRKTDAMPPPTKAGSTRLRSGHGESILERSRGCVRTSRPRRGLRDDLAHALRRVRSARRAHLRRVRPRPRVHRHVVRLPSLRRPVRTRAMYRMQCHHARIGWPHRAAACRARKRRRTRSKRTAHRSRLQGPGRTAAQRRHRAGHGTLCSAELDRAAKRTLSRRGLRARNERRTPEARVRSRREDRARRRTAATSANSRARSDLPTSAAA